MLASRPLSEPVEEPANIPGTLVRPFWVSEDVEASLRAYNEAFEGHWAHRPERLQDWAEWMQSPQIHPELSWVAESLDEPGRIVGFCICAICSEPVGPCRLDGTGRCREGWVDLLGTSPDWRGRGLGKSLVLRGLRSMQAVGLNYALLGVDSEHHTGAGYLYAQVGFTVPGLPQRSLPLHAREKSLTAV